MEISEPFALFNQFAQSIWSLPDRSPLTKDDLLTSKFRLYEEGRVEIYYAPFDHVNEKAKVVLVGITPGWTQMEVACRCARQALLDGLLPAEVWRRAKQQASFAGLMRKNLISMLGELDLPQFLDVPSSESLFGDYSSLLHTTSVIRYPVFINGANYTGHVPELLATACLRRFVFDVLGEELRSVNGAMIIPLGKTVSDALQVLADRGAIEVSRCLMGFPHPSGANGHRLAQFVARRAEMKQRLSEWFKGSVN
jgi:hypothetical protein